MENRPRIKLRRPITRPITTHATTRDGRPFVVSTIATGTVAFSADRLLQVDFGLIGHTDAVRILSTITIYAETD